MASNINANNIDGTYPVAGVDNDSQGFRTNFTNIKNNFTNAKAELEDLQSKVLLKSALLGTTLNNAMSGSVLSGGELRNFSETEIDLGTAPGTLTLDFSAGFYYKTAPTGSITLQFNSWPSTGKVGRMRLKVVISDPAYTLTLPAAVSLGTSTVDGYSSNVITFPGTGTYYFEFVTDDAGTTIHIQDLTRPRKATATSSIWGNTSVGSYNYFNYANVTTGFTTTVSNTLLIDSISTLATGTVYLPNAPTDGQVVKIAANNAVTALTLTANVGTILGPATTLSANTFVTYQYVAGPQKWFKIG